MSGLHDDLGTSDDFTVEEIQARLTRLEIRLDDVEADYAPDSLSHPADEPSGTGGYRDLDSWVEGFFAVTFTRSLGGEWRWCRRWREHPEAVFRLDALWRSFETLRRDPGMGTALWLRDHLDTQHGLLLSNRGPFALCTTTRHEILPPLPLNDGVTDDAGAATRANHDAAA
jgi:hypothetical protein